MCFTVNVNIVKEELEKRFNTSFIDHEHYRPSYYYHAHALPDLPVAGYFENQYNIRLLKWGLIPGWIDGAEEAKKIRYMTFNAKAETVASRPSFAASFNGRRCLVPVRGFYEWQHKGSQKIPWYIYLPQSEIMMLAGLYDSWRDPLTGRNIHTFTIITSKANKLLSEIHNTKKRMPVILQDHDEEAWLNPGTSEYDLTEILKPYPDEILRAHTISPLIGNAKMNRNTSELVKPYTYPSQTSLFE